MLMSKSRLEKFLYALYSLDSSDLPTPLSRIEELYKCLVTGEEPPTFEPLSRVEKYLMAILGVYDIDSLPNPLSRVEVLLYKLATGDYNLDDVKSFLSEHEELLAGIIRNGGAGGNIDIEYVLYTLSTEFNTLYNTAEKPVKSAILKGKTDENLQSVKMPVLTTTGKNLFDGKLLDGFFNNDISSIGGDGKIYKSIKIKLAKGTYTLSFDNPILIAREIIDGIYSQKYVTCSTYTFTVNTDGYYGVSFRNPGTAAPWTNKQVMIEKGTTATTYEPFKSNILSTPQDLELRGIGDVQDTLDCLTGEVTERIGEVVLDGSERWSEWRVSETSYGFALRDYKIDFKPRTIPICDILPSINYVDAQSKTVDKGIALYTSGSESSYSFFIRLPKTECTGLEDFKTKIQQNPIAVQYQLATESIKTVDLSTVDQDGNDTELSTFNDLTHVTLSSEGLIPKAELEVATKNEEVLNTMSLEMDDISATQTTLEETSNTQSENVDATMIATTEIYEQLL